MYDLLIKGGRLIDPSQNLDCILDIAITHNKIGAVTKDIPPQQGHKIVDAGGKIVIPGIIDLHCHVAGSLTAISVDPDAAGVNQGVTTVVDGGSTGEATFLGFQRYVIPPSHTGVFCFLHLGSLGLTVMPELGDWDEINPEATSAAIDAHRDIIKGIKLRLVGNTIARDGLKVVEVAKKVAGQFGLPIMVHIGDLKRQVSPTLTQEVLPLLEAGDILSHIYTKKFGSIMRSDGTALPELRAAMKRGVVLDTALGTNHFSFEVARKAIEQSILPTTLSTDLGAMNLNHLVYGMTVTMSKFLALGLGLSQVVEMSTINPARAIGEQKRIGCLRYGMAADVSILQLRSGRWRLEDSEKETIEVDRLLVPVMSVKAGKTISAQPTAWPRPMN